MEKYKITKELFVTVMDITKELAHLECIKETIEYRFYQGYLCKEDINDFFFKCKAYALKSGYSLMSCTTKSGGKACIYSKDRTNIREKTYSSTSEQQAVFDSLNFIIK